MPLLALTFAMHFGGVITNRLYTLVMEQLEVHVRACALARLHLMSTPGCPTRRGHECDYGAIEGCARHICWLEGILHVSTWLGSLSGDVYCLSLTQLEHPGID